MSLSLYELNFRDVNELKKELMRLDVDVGGVNVMANKGFFKIYKIEQIPAVAANILKQEMLARGGDVALPRQAYVFGKDVDVLIMGTLAQLKSVQEKLLGQPFISLHEIAVSLKAILERELKPEMPYEFKWGKYQLNFSKPLIMGVLNVTPDSFSDGGDFVDAKKALEHALNMVKAGADIIDVGGMSSRPGAIELTEKQELERVLPVLKLLKKKVKVPISIDTYKGMVAREALENGACMVNDIFGLRDEAMLKTVSEFNVPVVIMHMQGKPQIMQESPHYGDVVSEVYQFLSERVSVARQAGLEQIMVDPGIGFGKRLEDNLALIKNLGAFKSLGCPLLLGTSRKSFIGTVNRIEVPKERTVGTIVSSVMGILRGANIIRVHDVEETRKMCEMIEALI